MDNATPPTPNSSDNDHAGVRIPPPILFLSALAAGLVLEWLWPLGWFDVWPPLARYGIGALLAAAGVGLMASAMGLFRRAGTAIPPWEPTTALVTGGIYRFSRNPIYVSVVILYLGLALLFGASWSLVLLIPAVAVLQVAVIRHEEAYLERRFGEAYRAYRARVRRWI
jgi:protein-S-isoprenylcysteine O-methyltransferase Ste14